MYYLYSFETMYVYKTNEQHENRFFLKHFKYFSFGLNTKVYDNALKHVLNINIYIYV